MTIAEFRKKHPGCRVGYPSPSFPLIMLLLCAGFVILMLKYLIHVVQNFRAIEDLRELMAAFGAVCLSFSVSVGVYALAKRLGEVLDWIRFGRCMFAVADDEALVVDEKGESVVFPLVGVTKLEWWQHRIEIKMNAQYSESAALEVILRRMFQPGDDGPGAKAFFEALAPRVKKVAPQAEVIFRKLPPIFGS